MAGHLMQPINAIHKERVKIALLIGISKQRPFDRYKVDSGWYQLLTSEYQMNEEHGKVDELIFCYIPKERDKIYEYHLDKDKKINAVYLVM